MSSLMRLLRLGAVWATFACLAACQTAPDDPAGAFLRRNARAPGVVSLPALEYRVIASGAADGPHPKRSDDVTVAYEGRLASGKLFDSATEQAPATFELGRLISGWVTALQLMRPGDDWMVWIPPQMAYGFTDHGPIPAGSVLVFRIKLLSVAPHAKAAPAA